MRPRDLNPSDFKTWKDYSDAWNKEFYGTDKRCIDCRNLLIFNREDKNWQEKIDLGFCRYCRCKPWGHKQYTIAACNWDVCNELRERKGGEFSWMDFMTEKKAIIEGKVAPAGAGEEIQEQKEEQLLLF